MGRPREFNEDQALMQAMNLFWSKGYEATSLQDLLQTMDLSKSSFYQTFTSKHNILERSLTQYRQIIVQEMDLNLQNAESGLQFIKNTLLGVAHGVDQPGGRRGCLVMNCASEFAQSDAVIAGLVTAGTAQFKQVFRRGVQQAQQEGDISTTKNPDVLAQYLVGCKSGLETMAKAGTARAEMEKVVEVMVSALTQTP